MIKKITVAGMDELTIFPEIFAKPTDAFYSEKCGILRGYEKAMDWGSMGLEISKFPSIWLSAGHLY
jgi:hypothetical protein